jgi:hypothetical protein
MLAELFNANTDPMLALPLALAAGLLIGRPLALRITTTPVWLASIAFLVFWFAVGNHVNHMTAAALIGAGASIFVAKSIGIAVLGFVAGLAFAFFVLDAGDPVNDARAYPHSA